jgi:hypothetical protein
MIEKKHNYIFQRENKKEKALQNKFYYQKFIE